jgi:AcrR family transcriptional regulator
VESKQRGPGRPADPAIEPRVYRAALDTYGRLGWAGLTIHGVATDAKVGKAAIYRRWADKGELLVDSLMSLDDSRPSPDSGLLREDIIDAVMGELDAYLSRHGLVRLRAQVEAKAYPELFGSAMERFRLRRYEAGKAMIDRAITRGEIPPKTNVPQLLDAIVGMTMNHFLAVPQHKMAALRRNKRKFAESVADFAMKALSANVSERSSISNRSAPTPKRGKQLGATRT